MSYARRGMGMYPDETCFDPTRPSILPYWLDDFSETACKANLLLCGNPTCNTAAPGTPGAAPQTNANAAAACAAGGGSWDPSSNLCTPSLLGQYSSYLPWIFAALGVLLVIPMFEGRR